MTEVEKKEQLNIWAVLTHLGDINKAVTDAVKLITDIVHRQPFVEDVVQELKDIEVLLADGVIPLPPGTTPEQVVAVIEGLLPKRSS